MTFDFVDFWGGFNNFEREWLFNSFLRGEIGAELDSENPDFIVYSFSGNAHNAPRYDNVTKVYYTAENHQKSNRGFQDADFTVSHHRPYDNVLESVIDGKRHLYCPIYLRAFGPDKLREIDSFNVDTVLRRKEGWCCLITRNRGAKRRREIFKYLNENYREVDSAGQAYNNMDGWTVPGKWKDQKEFVQKYKFMISAENDTVGRIPPGYASEKIFNAFRGQAVPIYWGDPEIGRLFNKDAMMDVRDFESLSEVEDRVRRLNEDEAAYRDVLSESIFRGGDITNHEAYDEARFRRFFQKVANHAC